MIFIYQNETTSNADTQSLSCADGGVLGVVPGMIGVMQALEAVKIALDIPCESSIDYKLILPSYSP